MLNNADTVVVHKSVLIRGGTVPIELASHVTNAEYQVICSSVQRCQSECSSMALMFECGVGVVFCFWCGFCFHPCILSMKCSTRACQCKFLTEIRVMVSRIKRFLSLYASIPGVWQA
jgi:hypothetical protein